MLVKISSGIAKLWTFYRAAASDDHLSLPPKSKQLQAVCNSTI